MPMNPEFRAAAEARPRERDAVDPRGAQAMALFMQLDERGKKTALAMLAVAVKLHAEPHHG